MTKPVVCIYCEGSDAKLAVVAKDKETIRVLKVASLTMSSMYQSPTRQENDFNLPMSESGGELSFDSLDDTTTPIGVDVDANDIAQVAASLSNFQLSKMEFIPIITEPTVNFHVYEGPREEKKNKLIDAIIKDIQTVKGISVAPDGIDYMELNSNQLLSVFIEGDIHCVSVVNLLASYIKKRYLKIPTIKTTELALAYFVGKTNKFFPEDHSLIIYIGKEYSKLIFLEGQKLKHIGSTLDIGTKNLHTYDVYFSKILLEMENGQIPKLDNIIICGEDRSENLMLSFYGTFPEAIVSELKFEDLVTRELPIEDIENLALYAVPISAAVEYFDELDHKHKGVNFLPKYVQENQKFLQFGWHSYALLPFLFGAAMFFTLQTLSNYRTIDELDSEVSRLALRQLENQVLVEQITPLDNRINSFDETQSVLDTVAAGSSLWNYNLSNISDFAERRRNFWISKLDIGETGKIRIIGYSLSRSVLTEFAKYLEVSNLKNIKYEPLREKNAYSYTIEFDLAKKDTTGTK
jgi:hypothetical protein